LNAKEGISFKKSWRKMENANKKLGANEPVLLIACHSGIISCLLARVDNISNENGENKKKSWDGYEKKGKIMKNTWKGAENRKIEHTLGSVEQLQGI
jgi:broad specificity phosphatase PhoE